MQMAFDPIRRSRSMESFLSFRKLICSVDWNFEEGMESGKSSTVSISSFKAPSRKPKTKNQFFISFLPTFLDFAPHGDEKWIRDWINFTPMLVLSISKTAENGFTSSLKVLMPSMIPFRFFSLHSSSACSWVCRLSFVRLEIVSKIKRKKNLLRRIKIFKLWVHPDRFLLWLGSFWNYEMCGGVHAPNTRRYAFSFSGNNNNHSKAGKAPEKCEFWQRNDP